MSESLFQQIAMLSDEEREAVLADMDQESMLYDWSVMGRPEQMFPADDSWDVGLYLAGRGSGKTRSAVEWIREKARYTNQGKLRFLLVARTAGDVRQTVVDGESGLLNIYPPSEEPEFKPSIKEIHFQNGNIAVLRSADEPSSIRGIQSHYSYGDEVAAWKQTPDDSGLTAWDNLRFATRLGANPQVIATTTPKRVKVLYDLLAEADRTGRIHVNRGSTFDNEGNLSAAYIEGITGIYGGTRIGEQELMGEMLSAVEGALWTDEMLLAARVNDFPPFAPLRVIGVDPSVAENPGDECGIVAVASTADHDLYRRKAWVLEDASVQGAPEVWAKAVVRLAQKYACPVVAEVNQGGSLVAGAIHNIDPSIKVLEVHARQGKQLRAEPITLAYDQGRVSHVNPYDELVDLETQMTSWIPGTGKSPDRVDALVHALTALLIKPPPGLLGGRITAKSMARRSIDTGRRGRGPSPFLRLR